MDPNRRHKCRAVCAALGRAAVVLESLSDSQLDELARLHDTSVGPMQRLADDFARIVPTAERLDAEQKATSEALDAAENEAAG